VAAVGEELGALEPNDGHRGPGVHSPGRAGPSARTERRPLCARPAARLVFRTVPRWRQSSPGHLGAAPHTAAGVQRRAPDRLGAGPGAGAGRRPRPAACAGRISVFMARSPSDSLGITWAGDVAGVRSTNGPFGVPPAFRYRARQPGRPNAISGAVGHRSGRCCP
jgi:hypothetical protein